MNRYFRLGWVFVSILLLLGLRLVALRSDPFPRLDWSAGLLTDEGFNIHNARNVILFGHARTDAHNNMLFSPLYHYGQIAVFKVIGVGSVQARLISVVCSLLTLALLWAAVRRIFDNRIAFTSVLFLGLDHTNLLYNRMALMDTPAALPSVMAFYAFTRSLKAETNPTSRNQKLAWLIACGALIGLAVTVRSVCIYLVPVPFLALGVWTFRHSSGEPSSSHEAERCFGWTGFVALALAMLVVFLLYYLLWYWPHHAELAAMSQYYRSRQLPGSAARLASNLYTALLGSSRSLANYLFHHTPVVFTLALIGILFRPKTRAHPAEIYLVAWLVLGWGLLASTSYSPSRYYVTTYPALAVVAAIALWRLPELWKRWQQADTLARLLRAALIWFLAYQAIAIVLDHYGLFSRSWATALLFGLPLALSILDYKVSVLNWTLKLFGPKTLGLQRNAVVAVMALWFLFNAYWLGAWLIGLDYSQYQMSQWLTQNVPAGSVLIGDVAPGVCLDNAFIAVYVEPGLWNDVRPIETMGAQHPNAPRYIVTSDGWKMRFWMTRYPELVSPQRTIKLAQILKWQVGVYEAEP